MIGHQVFKFSPDGKLLMTLGKPGGNRPGAPAEPDSFYQPNDVLVAPNGEIWVCEGHGGANSRLIKFDKDGKFIKEFGKKGNGPEDWDQPHTLAMDSRGRLFVGDRSNNRIKILDQEGKLLAEWLNSAVPAESISIDRTTFMWRIPNRGLFPGIATAGNAESVLGVRVMVSSPLHPRPAETAPEHKRSRRSAVDAAGNCMGPKSDHAD